MRRRARLELLALASLIATRVASGADCNANGTPDIEEIRSGALPDCNGNGVPDACDLEDVNYGVVAGEKFLLQVTPRELIVQDINGDARPDVIGAHPETHIVRILWNSGKGAFDPVVNWFAAENVRAIAPIDLDGDGRQELAMGGSRGLSFIFHDPGIQLPAILLDTEIVALASGDFDLDADIDLAAAVPFGIRILENQGNAVFSPREPIPVGSSPVEILATDLDGDGHRDIATANRIDGPVPAGNISVFMNRGDGSFDTARNYAASPDPLGLIANDLDGDGDADLATASRIEGGVRVLLADDRGRYAMSESLATERGLTSMISADLDGDGAFDLGVSGIGGASGVALFLNLGATEFTRMQFRTGEFYHSMAEADIDGDGLRDIVASIGGGYVEILEGAFVAASTDCNSNLRPDDCELAGNDCNANEQPDACDISSGSSPDCNRNGIPDECDVPGGNLRFEKSSFITSPFMRLLSSSDLDADGRRDLFAVAAPGLLVFWNAGAQGFLPQIGFQAGSRAADATAGDMDGDGDGDIVLADEDAQELLIIGNRGGRAFADERTINITDGANRVVAADLDGDLDLDLAATAARRLVVLENRGAIGGIRAVGLGLSGRGILEVADLDGDGLLDLVAEVDQPTALRIFWNWGSLVLRGSTVLETTFPIQAAAILDVDADGDGDIFLSLSGSTLVFFRNLGMRTFALEGFSPQAIQDVGEMLPGDLDLDGDQDLAMVLPGPHGLQVAALLNRGVGMFDSPKPIAPGGGASSNPAAGDWNGDGVLDLAVTSGNEVLVLTNVTRPPFSLDADLNGIPDECRRLPFHRGDSNADGDVNLSDPVFTLGHLFRGEPAPACLEAADANNDARVEITDPIATLEFLFRGGTPPAPPGAPPAFCGLDTDASGSAGDIGCGAYEGCGA